MRRLPLLLVVPIIATLLVLGLAPGRSHAHNSLLSSDPTDGSVVQLAPTGITWQFDQAVPLDTMSVILIDAAGVRNELSGSIHGPQGESQVVTPLPPTLQGEVSLRWRLVGPDGHVVTGRVAFTIAPTAATTTSPGATSLPSPTTVAPADEASPDDALSDVSTYSTPSVVRWLLRYGSYAAIMTVVGILFTAVWVWPGAAVHRALVRSVSIALAATASLAVGQLLVVASDVSGEAPWAAWGSIDEAMSTFAGAAFVVRAAFALGLWLVLFPMNVKASEIYWPVAMLASVVLLGTWAFAGHSRSQRWSQLGVLSDIAHHGAAAAWIAGLAILGWIVTSRFGPDESVPALRRFSGIAAGCVVVLAVTGLAQSIRLVGGLGNLLEATHGRLLAAKLIALGAMLLVANANRRRVQRIIADPARVAAEHLTLRRSMVVEFGIGAVIVGITAALVVSPPSTSADGGAPVRVADPVYTT